ncbi:hypothetical protein AB0D46_12015 [Streptomyces sp. NPDC048383]|uniref:hypothetical protein n=1 Tax=Streptomyces sp. NPDC048383 TaxID=3155386 RepID=UPI0034194A25
MSTPPNPPSDPVGPPTEPEGTPIPETPSRPSLSKPPTDAPPPTPGPSLDKTPADAPPATPGPSLDKTPADARPTPPGPSLDKAPQDAPPATPAPTSAPPTPMPAPPPPTRHDHFGPDVPPAAPTPPAPPLGGFGAPTAPGAPATPSGHADPAEHNPFAPPAPGGFAPLVPTPPPGGYGAPANAWGAPAGPGGGHPGHPHQPGHPGYPGYPPPAPATPPANGVAVASLVLGILAVPASFTPFFFWIGTLIGLTGLGLGIGGLVSARSGAPRKGMALTGTILGVVSILTSIGGFFLTVGVLDQASDRMERSIENGEWDGVDDEPFTLPSTGPTGGPSAGRPPKAPAEGPGISTPLAFGQTYTYPNGIQVSLSSPKKYVSKSEVFKIGNAVQLTLTITNTTDKPHEVIYAVPDIRDEKGNEGEVVYDVRMPQPVEGVIAPGRSATGTIAYEIPEGATTIDAEVSPGGLQRDVKFSGPIG